MCVWNQNIATVKISFIFKPRANLWNGWPGVFVCENVEPNLPEVDYEGPNLTWPFFSRWPNLPRYCWWWGEGGAILAWLYFPIMQQKLPSILSCFKLFLFQIVSLNWTKHAKNISQELRLKLVMITLKHFKGCWGKISIIRGYLWKKTPFFRGAYIFLWSCFSLVMGMF